MLKTFEIFISPILENSGYWENKQLIYIGSVRVRDNRLSCVSKKDIVPMVYGISLKHRDYEVWSYNNHIYRFLMFLSPEEVYNGQ